MGVGLPFAVGAKAANPDAQVICLHGDGSFGQNAMELDTAVRHKLPLLCIISLNGGWTADPERNKPGRDLGYTRYDKMAEALGCYAEYVEDPEDTRPALHRARCRAGRSRPEHRHQDRGATARRAAAWHHRCQCDPFGPLRKPGKYSGAGKRVAPGRVTRRMSQTPSRRDPRRRCDARCGRFHPANAMTVHEVVGKSALSILGEPGPRWG
jgi:hypothetical protein